MVSDINAEVLATTRASSLIMKMGKTAKMVRVLRSCTSILLEVDIIAVVRDCLQPPASLVIALVAPQRLFDKIDYRRRL